ncbi:hypothetical protein GCM10007103_08900 [Salinimicrobium marinum]|uniref:Uncharacterized protein n=2 Tax=Salinimicrobium marinum TaxID=680283 RepID=A0A918VWH4_9FLAO|nr:hypothetical protein GCM10007103_08900 [Salinimicrobium marinum]
MISFSGSAQEFGESESYIVEREDHTVYIEMPEVNASLSFLAPNFEKQMFTLRDSDIFKKNEKREVNMMAMMEKERRDRERSLVELDSPMPTLSRGEKGIIQISNQMQMHNRGSNYDIYTGEKKIPAYKEMRAGLFNGYYSPNVGGRYYAPYSPFLR